MPCYDDRPRQAHEQLEKDFQRLTRVACDMSKFIAGKVRNLGAETVEWIVEHEQLDRKHTENEQ